METLHELVHLMEHYNGCGFCFFSQDNPDKVQNRYSELYTGIRIGRWTNEPAIAAHFGYASPNEKGYKRLKEGLADKLLDALVAVEGHSYQVSEDFPSTSNELLHLCAAAEVLKKKGTMKLYSEVAQKCLRMALAMGNRGVVVELCRHLRFFYRKDPAYAHLMEKAKSLFDSHWPVYQMEIDIHSDYFDLIDRLNGQKSYKRQLAKAATMLYYKYEPFLKGTESVVIQYYARIFHIYGQTFQHLWEPGLCSAEDAIHYFKKTKKPVDNIIFAFQHLRVCCMIMMKRHKDVNLLLGTLTEGVSKGSSVWFKTQELAMVNHLYAGDYGAVWDIQQMAMPLSSFSEIAERDKETWNLYKGYINYLYLKGDLLLPESAKESVSGFRLKKWLNEMPLYSSEKRGGNIPVLILQMHYLILEWKSNPDVYNAIVCRVEALRKYVSRNLDKDCEHFRTDCFVSMLQLLPKYMATGNWDELFKSSLPMLWKMESVSTDIINTSFEMEVVPYDRQWDWIMDVLSGVRLRPARPSVPASLSLSLRGPA